MVANSALPIVELTELPSDGDSHRIILIGRLLQKGCLLFSGRYFGERRTEPLQVRMLVCERTNLIVYQMPLRRKLLGGVQFLQITFRLFIDVIN